MPKVRQSINIDGWTVTQSPGGYFRAFRKIDGRTVSRYIGRDPSRAEEILTAANLEIENRAAVPVIENSTGAKEMTQTQQEPQNKAPAPPIEEPSLIEIAQNYARCGLPVGPVHTRRAGACTCGRKNCDRPGDHPARGNVTQQTGSVQGGFYGTLDKYACMQWFRTPGLNIAVELGSRTKRLALVVQGEAGEASLLDLISTNGELPETIQMICGDTRIFIFSWPPKRFYGFFERGLGDGLVMLFDSGSSRGNRYLLLPPSTTSSGECWQWIEQHAPGEVALAEAPTWLIDGKGKHHEN